MQYRLVCLDLDGTLLNPYHEITSYTKAVIGRLQRDGVAVALVSARMPQAMERFHKELELTGPMIAYGGGSIFQDGILDHGNIGPGIPHRHRLFPGQS